jgi:hypothetical protein
VELKVGSIGGWGTCSSFATSGIDTRRAACATSMQRIHPDSCKGAGVGEGNI